MTDLRYINAADPASPLDITPVTGRIGGEVRGVTLGATLSDGDIAAIRQALARHKVLFFRGQHHLDDAGQEDFAARLGRTVAHPTVPIRPGTRSILEIESRNGRAASSWHTDVTFVPAYPEASILRGVVIPEAGGDTAFANTVTAYQDLPDLLRDFVDRAWAVHSNDYDYATIYDDATDEEREQFQNVFASTVYETEHPLVRVHPETGERSLVLGHFLKRIIGLSSADSARLFAILQEHVTKPENVVRWRWNVGDVVIWDNRATQHRAVADFGQQARIVRRVTLDGPVPVSIDGRRSRALSPTEQIAAAA
ncbi:TauD/TfdA family dioxygenase [Sphingobium sp. HBC34]|uniref:TauD/TfdA family dioxygenase n=1 Tax=Sphingobium cyanobacteriorum TaxID=3063954 RepID=A0ABT8ZM78_9SPHN|nr:TauD/TfdA family dioxygenase [Sphingobium sp. HBC34]MDO7835633.1 TauD/TfdA family dioxygenase [Sphingobium sp. HBC34]